MRAAPELRALVEVKRLNLIEPPFGVGELDLIFCRNVLIYFDQETKQRVIDALLEHLAPGGYLFLGHAESVAGGRHPGLRLVVPTVYRREGA